MDEGIEEIIRVVRETKMSKLLLVRDRPRHFVIWKEVHNSSAIKTEIKALKILKSCKEVVRYRRSMTFGDSNFIELEYLNGQNLTDVLGVKAFSEDLARGVFGSLAIAVLRIHRKGVYHRDLKPSNIMLLHNADSSLYLKLIDFGVSCFGNDDSTFTKKVGTMNYISPQMIGNEPYRASMSDVYSMGIILYELLFMKTPFDMNDRVEFISTPERQPKITFPIDKPISLELQDLISRMLDPCEETRSSIDDVVADSWLNIPNASALLQKKRSFFSLFRTSSEQDFFSID